LLEAPLGYPHVIEKGSKTLTLTPGKHILRDGVTRRQRHEEIRRWGDEGIRGNRYRNIGISGIRKLEEE
jgi:hypothetical protein